jgi:hypothetical protein
MLYNWENPTYLGESYTPGRILHTWENHTPSEKSYNPGRILHTKEIPKHLNLTP